MEAIDEASQGKTGYEELERKTKNYTNIEENPQKTNPVLLSRWTNTFS